MLHGWRVCSGVWARVMSNGGLWASKGVGGEWLDMCGLGYERVGLHVGCKQVGWAAFWAQRLLGGRLLGLNAFWAALGD